MAHNVAKFKVGDTYRLRVTLKDKDGPVDLTGASVQFVMQDIDGSNVVDSAATVISATDGTVKYEWQAADVDSAGDFEAEWVVTFDDGQERTFPNDGYNDIIIVEEVTTS